MRDMALFALARIWDPPNFLHQTNLSTVEPVLSSYPVLNGRFP